MVRIAVRMVRIAVRIAVRMVRIAVRIEVCIRWALGTLYAVRTNKEC